VSATESASVAETTGAASTVPSLTGPLTTGPGTRIQPVTRRPIGASDLAVFPIVLGGDVFGWRVDDDEARAVLDTYADFGGNLVDTADSYSGGRSETLIGGWMASRRTRDRMIVSTKIGKSAEFPGTSPQSIVGAVEASLRRLRVETIDLLFLHLDDRAAPFEETLLTVDRLIRDGKVRWFGGCEYPADRLVEARIACGIMGVAPMVAVQHEYSLMQREGYEAASMGVAEAQGLGVMPRHALAGGFLTGKYRSRDAARASRHGRALDPYFVRRGFRSLAAVQQVAEEQEVAMTAVALAWLLTRPTVVAPVVSAIDVRQLRDLLTAPMISLTREQVRSLDEVSAWK